ncbi:hypothetical protein J1N35_012050 [Gossypium stocksii]|uniref:Uncharacterized protein n=1 Tax=Gossypium stocksii TaxID=47602 RepID=A0A9D4AC12_9ROSI|nr:hypothetical protein J1N35_012050 [Gossypium stocksii]
MGVVATTISTSPSERPLYILIGDKVQSKCRDRFIIGSNPKKATDVYTTSCIVAPYIYIFCMYVFRVTSVPIILRPNADVNVDTNVKTNADIYTDTNVVMNFSINAHINIDISGFCDII